MGEEKQAIDPDIPPAQTGELGGGEKEGLSGALKNTDSEQPNDTERVIPAEKTQKGVKEKQSGNLVFKVAKGFVYVLVPVLFFGCLYYLRGLSIKVDALHSRMDKIALRLEGTVRSGQDEVFAKLSSLEKNVRDADVEESRSLKKVTVFLGDLRFKIKELEKKIATVGEQEVSLPPEEAGENSETAGPVVDKDTDGEELALPLTPFESQTLEDPVEVLNPERSSEIQELDNEFIGELVDEVITKKIAEYDEGKKEEEIKKKKTDEQTTRDNYERLAIAIEKSVIKLAGAGKRAVMFCKEKLFNWVELLGTDP